MRLIYMVTFKGFIYVYADEMRFNEVFGFRCKMHLQTTDYSLSHYRSLIFKIKYFKAQIRISIKVNA